MKNRPVNFDVEGAIALDNLDALKKSLVAISARMSRMGVIPDSSFMPFPAVLFEEISERDVEALQACLGNHIGLHGDAKYSHWPSVFHRLNLSFIEERDAFLQDCKASVSSAPFSKVSTPLLLFLLAEAYLLERESWFPDRAIGDTEEAETEEAQSSKTARLKNLREAKAIEKQINAAATKLSKAIDKFEKSVRESARDRILPVVQRYVDKVLAEQMRDFRGQIEADLTESISLHNKAWIDPLSASLPEDGKMTSRAKLFVTIFDAIAGLASEATGGGGCKEATAALLETWKMSTTPDTIKHRRSDKPG